jgi:hypothetical protein
VNNAVARTAQLLAVAALPGLVGISGALDDPAVFDSGFGIAMGICAGLLLTGAALAGVLLRPPRRVPEPARVDCLPQCGVGGPAVAPARAAQ